MALLEVAREVFDLPALVRADLLALDAATGASPLLLTQFVDLDGYRKIFEGGKIPPPLAPLHAPKFFLGFRLRWEIVRVNRFAVHLLGEVQKSAAADASSAEDCKRSARGP
jgi:hypothetical protein